MDALLEPSLLQQNLLTSRPNCQWNLSPQRPHSGRTSPTAHFWKDLRGYQFSQSAVGWGGAVAAGLRVKVGRPPAWPGWEERKALEQLPGLWYESPEHPPTPKTASPTAGPRGQGPWGRPGSATEQVHW